MKGKFVIVLHLESDQSLSVLQSQAWKDSVAVQDATITKVQIAAVPRKTPRGRPIRGTRGAGRGRSRGR